MMLNLTNMSQPWGPPQPMESLWTNLNDGFDFEFTGGEEIPQTMIIPIGFGLIDKTEI